jgi:hypothetical protein
MSNDQALRLVESHKPEFMSHLFLSHLSRDNNSPKLVKNIFQRIAGDTQVVIASRDKETQVYHIRNAMVKRPGKTWQRPSPQLQLSLFQ